MRESRNCGIGSNGFEPGNDCAKGDGSGTPDETTSTATGSSEPTSDETKSQSRSGDLIQEAKAEAKQDGVVTNWGDMQELQPDQSDTDTIRFYMSEGYKALTGNASRLGAVQVDWQELDYAGKQYGTITNAEIAARIRSDLNDARLARQDELTAAKESNDAKSVERIEAEIAKEQKELKAQLIKTYKQEQNAARRVAMDEMREELEMQAAEAVLDKPVLLFRGLSLPKVELDRILNRGQITHSGANSWTANETIAIDFAKADTTGRLDEEKVPDEKVVLVTTKATRGIINRNPSPFVKESEIIRPPSSMNIERVVRSKDGILFLYLDEDEMYKD